MWVGKRAFDLVFASLGFLVLLPLFFLVALLIKLDSPGPIFFRQTRVGQGRKNFDIHKFRTMRLDAAQMGPQITIGNDARVTKIGFFLRKYKLDELPQLIDVILGKMSLVGPRPEVPRYVAYYSEVDASVALSVRPGITDWASIEFKDENKILGASLDPEREYVEKILPVKLSYHRKYVENASFLMDLKLIIRTLREILVDR